MKYVKHIATIVLSLYLILAMGGLGIFHHLCNCSPVSKNKTTILVEQSCCSQTNASIQSCHSSTQENTCGDDECESCSCETEVEILSINETLLAENVRINHSLSSQIIVMLFALQSQPVNDENLVSPTYVVDDQAPPKSGKEIHILAQSLKIPLSIS